MTLPETLLACHLFVNADPESIKVKSQCVLLDMGILPVI